MITKKSLREGLLKLDIKAIDENKCFRNLTASFDLVESLDKDDIRKLDKLVAIGDDELIDDFLSSKLDNKNMKEEIEIDDTIEVDDEFYNNNPVDYSDGEDTFEELEIELDDEEELLEEALTPQEELETIFANNDWYIESEGETIFGSKHYQIINKETWIDITNPDIDFQEELRKIVMPLVNAIDAFEMANDNVSTTWNFGINKDGYATAGIDLREATKVSEALNEEANTTIAVVKVYTEIDADDEYLDSNEILEETNNLFNSYANEIASKSSNEKCDVEVVDIDTSEGTIILGVECDEPVDVEALINSAINSIGNVSAKGDYLVQGAMRAEDDWDEYFMPFTITLYAEEVDAITNESLTEDDSEEPWNRAQVYDALYDITNRFRQNEGTIRCYIKEEKDMVVDILKQFYEIVDVSDGRYEGDNEMSWIVAYENSKVRG